MEWHHQDGGQDGATALTFRGPQGWGEPGLQREDVVYLLGKAGLTEATPNQVVFIVSLTAPVGCDGTELMVPWVRLHVRKELSFYFLFCFFNRNVLRKATL